VGDGRHRAAPDDADQEVAPVNDTDIIKHIDELVEEEHRLRAGEGLTAAQRDRLRDLEVSLDQCWDLLRQRRARRHGGEDPDEAHARPAEVVEHYQQ
jgi:hypothetical protein